MASITAITARSSRCSCSGLALRRQHHWPQVHPEVAPQMLAASFFQARGSTRATLQALSNSASNGCSAGHCSSITSLKRAQHLVPRALQKEELQVSGYSSLLCFHEQDCCNAGDQSLSSTNSLAHLASRFTAFQTWCSE